MLDTNAASNMDQAAKGKERYEDSFSVKKTEVASAANHAESTAGERPSIMKLNFSGEYIKLFPRWIDMNSILDSSIKKGRIRNRKISLLPLFTKKSRDIPKKTKDNISMKNPAGIMHESF